MMALDSQPFSIVEDAGFLRLLANVCPKYVMPSRKYFSEKIIPDIFSTIRTKLHEEIHPQGDKFPISFTTDIWTREAGGDSLISFEQPTISIQRVSQGKSGYFKYIHFQALTQQRPSRR